MPLRRSARAYLRRSRSMIRSAHAHQATVTFTKTNTNTWSYNIALPAGDATSSAGTDRHADLRWQWNLTSPTGDGQRHLVYRAERWSLGHEFFLEPGRCRREPVTQTASASNVASATQDGYTSGSYQGFSVDGNGIVNASFSNGQPEVVGQVAVASVANQQGLQATNNTAYVATLASGSAVIGTAGNAGRGTIEGACIRVFQCGRVDRVFGADRRSARLRGKLEVSNHLRSDHAGSHQHDPLSRFACAGRRDHPRSAFLLPDGRIRCVFSSVVFRRF